MSPLTASVLAGLLGLAFGSFANVVIHRVPQGRSVVRPGPACPACGAPVAPRDNLPLVGWLLLGGRCRSCRAPIPVSYPLVELAMGVLWFLLTFRLVAVGLGWAVPAYLALAFICVVLAVIDARTRLLPNRITYPAFPVMLGLLLLASIGLGDLGRLARGLLAAVVVGAFFLALALISPRGMGLGDVKLAPPSAWPWAGCRGGRWPSGSSPPSCWAAWPAWPPSACSASPASRCCPSVPGWSPAPCLASWPARTWPPGTSAPSPGPSGTSRWAEIQNPSGLPA